VILNRRYVRQHARDVLASLQLHATPGGPECTPELRKISGLTYAEMLEAARAANFRNALWQIGEQIGEMFAAVSRRCAPLASLPASEGPNWSEITAAWKG
jgi:hypothetical protein